MATRYQDNSSVSLNSPFGSDVVVNALSGVERVSQPFQFDLTLFSAKGTLNADDVLGKPVSVKLAIGEGERYFSGVVSDFSQLGFEHDLHRYQATVRPWFWFLTRTADCRIFQKKTVPEIFNDVCKDVGIAAPSQQLGSYEPREYCVQYRETDFAFLNRLLEEEGIFYFFRHSQGKHEMVLADDVGQLGTLKGYEKVPFYPASVAPERRERDHLTEWAVRKSFQPGKFATRDYDFEKSTTELAGAATVARKHDAAKYEVFDFPARTTRMTPQGVERVAKLRVQELQVGQTSALGSGDAAGLVPGNVFELEKHVRADLNMRYLIAATRTELTSGAYRSGSAAGSPMELRVEVEALDAREPYRPARTTPKPVIHGTQTAVVVGAKDAEIETDKYGRVRVQFHWDRYGKKNSESSCWIRVAQASAGKNFGIVNIPRIGQEVVVSFLEGDPDQPIVIGSVPNNDQMPTYPLPENKTRSGVMTRTTEKGAAANFNEIRFEDKKDAEEVYIHAEKDLNVVVENNQTISIGATKKDKGDRKTTIQNDDTIQIDHDRNTLIKNDDAYKVEKNLRAEVGEAETRKVGKDRTTDIKDDDNVTVGKKYTLKAGTEITLEVGQAKIVMKQDGTIEIKGTQVKVAGQAKVEVEAPTVKVSGDAQVEVSGAQTKIEGKAMLDLAASGVASLKGSLTKIG
jgi:type VI secretion system secreted protein VgrG